MRSEPAPACTAADLYDPRTGSSTTASTMLGCVARSSFTLLLDGTVLVAGGSDCNDDGVCGSNGAAELYVPAGVSLPPLPPSRARLPVFPSPTPVPTPLPPAAGPVPPNARSWTVTVDNRAPSPRRCSWPRTRGRVTARRVGDSERGPSRRHRAGDLPLPCQLRRMDQREPATGRRRRVGQRGPDRHPRQDPDPSGGRWGLVEPVAGNPRAERLRRLACAGHALAARLAAESCRTRELSVAPPDGTEGTPPYSDDPLAWYARSA